MNPQPHTYNAVLKDGRTVGYYFDTLPPEDAEQDYLSVTVPAEDTGSARELVRRGFTFTDRSIPIEIPLGRFRPPLSPGKKFQLTVKSQWDPEEIFSLARSSFETDDRFAADLEQKDAALKNELLWRFIGQLCQEGAKATCLYSADGLEGFDLWTVRGDAGRVVLGVMAERYRGTGVALSVYSQTALALREIGGTMLRDIVASSNPAALNLHAMLIRCAGGSFRFGPCRDHYKKERADL